MTPLLSDPVSIAIIAVCASIPLAAVAMLALIRGYTVSVHLVRPRRERGKGNRGDD